MKNLRKSWKLIALFAFGAIVCVVFVGRARADHTVPSKASTSLIYTPLGGTLYYSATNLAGAPFNLTVNVIDSNDNIIQTISPVILSGHSWSVGIDRPLITTPPGCTGNSCIVAPLPVRVESNCVNSSLEDQAHGIDESCVQDLEYVDANNPAEFFLIAFGAAR